MLGIFPTLAAGGGEKDLIELIFFVVIAAISIFGSILGKLFKKKDEDDEPEITVEESVFGEPDGSYGNAPRETASYENIPYISDEASDAERFFEPRPRAAENLSEKKFEPTPYADAMNLPPKQPTPQAAQPARGNVPAKNTDVLSDRDALRRAVLAHEILSPPLSLRE